MLKKIFLSKKRIAVGGITAVVIIFGILIGIDQVYYRVVTTSSSIECFDIAFHQEELSHEEVKQMLDEGSVTGIDLYTRPERTLLLNQVEIYSSKQRGSPCDVFTYMYKSAEDMRQLLQECGENCSKITITEK